MTRPVRVGGEAAMTDPKAVEAAESVWATPIPLDKLIGIFRNAYRVWSLHDEPVWGRCKFPWGHIEHSMQQFVPQSALEAEKAKWWECPKCAFRMDKCHVTEGLDPQCPVCREDAAKGFLDDATESLEKTGKELHAATERVEVLEGVFDRLARVSLCDIQESAPDGVYDDDDTIIRVMDYYDKTITAALAPGPGKKERERDESV